MSRMQNRNPSLPMEDAAEAVEREGGLVHLVYRRKTYPQLEWDI